MSSSAPPSPPSLRLAPDATYRVISAAAVEVLVKGHTMQLAVPLFRLLLEFAEPQPAATVFARLDGTLSLERYSEIVRQLEVSGILIAENPIGETENKIVIPDFRDLFQGDILRDEQLVAAMRVQLDSGRAVVIRDAIDADFAERVHRELTACEAWRPYEHISTLFHYHHHNLYSENDFPDSVREFKSVLEQPATRAFMARLCNRDCGGRVMAGASLYLPGDHSLPHRDFGLSRSVAFVWHLTKDWESSWGGHLYWCPSGTSVAPTFNCFMLFNVMESSLHLVTAVSPHARGKRLAVNGWWTELSAVGDEALAESGPVPVISAARYGKEHELLSEDGRVLAI
jgi:Rps23 Pro-64 3,4-dihydroxylase Tpa1-like proline 4-hydroxylase